MNNISELKDSIAILVLAGKEQKIGKYYIKRISPKEKFLEIQSCNNIYGTEWVSNDDILDFEVLGKIEMPS